MKKTGISERTCSDDNQDADDARPDGRSWTRLTIFLATYILHICGSRTTALVFGLFVGNERPNDGALAAVGQRRDVHERLLARGVLNHKAKAALVVPGFDSPL